MKANSFFGKDFKKAGLWEVNKVLKPTKAITDLIESIQCVEGQYGLQLLINLKEGGYNWFPVNKASKIEEGDMITPEDLRRIELVNKSTGEVIIRWDRA